MFDRHAYSDDVKRLDSIKDEDIVSSLKRDGACFFLSIDGDGKPSFISRRQGVAGNYPNKTDRLPHLASLDFSGFKRHIFATEIVHTGKTYSEEDSHALSSGILNSLPARAKDQQDIHGPLRVLVHDVISPKISTYGEKLELMKKLEQSIGRPEVLRSIDAKIGRQAFEELLKDTKERKLEGIVATSLTTPEDKNLRVKIKNFKTANPTITGITQEFSKDGNPKESAGALVMSDANGKQVATAGTGLTREMRKQIWQNPKAWIGQVGNVKYLDVARDKLRHPVWNGLGDGNVDAWEDL